MTEREKVIKGLECLAKQHGIVGVCEPENCPYGDLHTCANEIARDAIALLKAQEPVEPILDIDEWKCGNCGHALGHQELLGDNVLFHEQYNYCPECGKKVKWE